MFNHSQEVERPLDPPKQEDLTPEQLDALTERSIRWRDEAYIDAIADNGELVTALYDAYKDGSHLDCELAGINLIEAIVEQVRSAHE